MKQLPNIQHRRKGGVNFIMVGHTTRMAMVVGWCVRMCVCLRACVLACVHDMFAIYGNNILPRLIMIIIKIIFLYFTEIAHTDDFTLNEYPASGYNQDRLNECRELSRYQFFWDFWNVFTVATEQGAKTNHQD